VNYLPWKAAGEGLARAAPAFVCQACHEVIEQGFKKLQEEYRRLVASGVHPKVADRILCRIVSSV
jgi:hypothetical protein